MSETFPEPEPGSPEWHRRAAEAVNQITAGMQPELPAASSPEEEEPVTSEPEPTAPDPEPYTPPPYHPAQRIAHGPTEPETVAFKSEDKDDWGFKSPKLPPPPHPEPRFTKGPLQPETRTYHAPKPEEWAFPGQKAEKIDRKDVLGRRGIWLGYNEQPITITGEIDKPEGKYFEARDVKGQRMEVPANEVEVIDTLESAGVLGPVNFEGAEEVASRLDRIIEPESNEVAVYDENGKKEDGWVLERFTRDGSQAVLMRKGSKNPSYRRFVAKDQYDKWQAQAASENIEPERDSTAPGAKTTKEAKTKAMDDFDRLTQEVKAALEKGDQKTYTEKLAALEELLKNRSKEQGIDTAITEEAFKPKALAERIKEAHEKMLKIENIDRLRNQVNSAARKNQKAELIDQYFEGGTPYEASADVKNYVSNLLKMSEEAFAHLKSQLKESVNPKAIEGSLIPGGDYWVVRSDGSRKLLEAVLKEVKFGEKPVVIVEVGEGEAANTREVPLAAFMEWQKNVPQAVKDQRVKARQEKEEAEKAAKEAAEASGSVGENEEDLTVNLNDPEEAHTSVLQVDKNLKEAKLRRIERDGTTAAQAGEEPWRKWYKEEVKRQRLEHKKDRNEFRRVLGVTVGKLLSKRLLRREVIEEIRRQNAATI